MIRDPSKFLFVDGLDVDEGHPHGDLDRIVMTGRALPERQPPIEIRGEDVAFLMEAAGQRLAIWRGQFPPPAVPIFTFSRLKDGAQIANVVTNIKRVFSNAGSISTNRCGWMKPDSDFEEKASQDFRDVDPDYGVFENVFLSTSDMNSSAHSFAIPSPVSARELLKIYEDVMLLDRPVLSTTLNDCTPDIVFTDNPDEYYSHTGTRPETGWASPAGLSYMQVFSGAYFYNPETEQQELRMSSDVTYNLKTFEMSFPVGIAEYLSTAGSDLEMWAAYYADDFDRSRTPGQMTCYFLKKLMQIPDSALREGRMHFPSGYLSSQANQIKNAAAEICATGEWNTPFVDRSAETYRSHEYTTFNHTISITPYRLYLVARTGDRTKWNERNNT